MSGMKLQPPLNTKIIERHVTETTRAANAVSASRRVNWVNIANLGVKLLRNVMVKHVQGTTARHSSSSFCTCTSFPPGTKVVIGLIVTVHEYNAEESQHLFKPPSVAPPCSELGHLLLSLFHSIPGKDSTHGLHSAETI